jgi:glutamate--cysteine ligase
MVHVLTPNAPPGSKTQDTSTGPAADSLVHTLDDLVAHFQRGNKTRDQQRVGLEHEKIGVALDPDGGVRPLPYEDAPGRPQIRTLLQGLIEKDWQPVHEGDNVIALRRAGASVTLEPGGQFELSGRPQPTEVECSAELDEHLRELLPLAESSGVAFLGCGFRPLGTWSEVPYMPKGRYRVMREYLPTRGALGVEMMKRTATVQANLDFVSEADAVAKMRLGIGLGPLVTAIYAASPLVDGKDSGYKSYRASCWLDTDPDRCGILPFMFREDAGFRAYAEWALDVPMFFVYRHGTYTPAGGLTFRRFMAEGAGAERATLADWELHLSTLFPEARLKQYVELRSADAGPLPMIRALPALWRGLFYSDDSRAAAWALVADLSIAEREELRREVPRHGLQTRLRGRPLAPLCAEMLRIAQAGVRALGGGPGVEALEPLLAATQAGRCPADDILDAYRATGGNPRALVDKLRLRLE